jgi:hypothetical protein
VVATRADACAWLIGKLEIRVVFSLGLDEDHSSAAAGTGGRARDDDDFEFDDFEVSPEDQAQLFGNEYPEFMPRAVTAAAAEEAEYDDTPPALGEDAEDAEEDIQPARLSYLVSEIAAQYKHDVTFDDRALHVLKQAGEHFVVSLFAAASAAAGATADDDSMLRSLRAVTPPVLARQMKRGIGNVGSPGWGDEKRVRHPVARACVHGASAGPVLIVGNDGDAPGTSAAHC